MWFTNINTFYSHYKADFGAASRQVNLEVFSYNIYMQHTLKFGKKKDWTGEISGFYNSPTIYQGTFEGQSLWSIDGGLQKVMLKGKGNLKVSVSDIFHTLRWRGTSEFAGQKTIVNAKWESRQFKVSFTWRFGSNQVKAARNRKSAIEDENKRTESGGGIGVGN
jgi:hypothetical protein